MVPVMLQHVEHRTLLGKVGKGVVVAASSYAVSIQTNGDSLVQRDAVSTLIRPTGENRKKASGSLYLDELLIQKCKFRHRFTVHS